MGCRHAQLLCLLICCTSLMAKGHAMSVCTMYQGGSGQDSGQGAWELVTEQTSSGRRWPIVNPKDTRQSHATSCYHPP